MDNVAFSFCHSYPMYRFLLFCHNKRSSYDYFDFFIEEPFNHIFTEKVSYCHRDAFMTVENICWQGSVLGYKFYFRNAVQ